MCYTGCGSRLLCEGCVILGVVRDCCVKGVSEVGVVQDCCVKGVSKVGVV